MTIKVEYNNQPPEVSWEVVILKQFSLPGMHCVIVVEYVEGTVIPGKHLFLEFCQYSSCLTFPMTTSSRYVYGWMNCACFEQTTYL